MSEVKHVIPFEGKTKADVVGTGTFTFLTFESIKKLIEPAIDIDEDEKITGLIIKEDGISVRIN